MALYNLRVNELRLFARHTGCINWQSLLRKRALCVVLFLWTPLAFGEDISGVWKSAEAPVWVEISLAEGRAIVIRNDKHPERVGRTLLRNLKRANAAKLSWQGQLYVEKTGDFIDVDVSLPEVGRMVTTGKLGFFSKSMAWQRADKSAITANKPNEGASP